MINSSFHLNLWLPRRFILQWAGHNRTHVTSCTADVISRYPTSMTVTGREHLPSHRRVIPRVTLTSLVKTQTTITKFLGSTRSDVGKKKFM